VIGVERQCPAHLPASLAQPLQAVVFDLDGLMFNTEDLYDEVGILLLRRRGREFTADLKRRMMGRPDAISLQMMIDEHGLDATVAQLQREQDELFAETLGAKIQPMDGLVALLAALEAARLPKAIATSSGRACVANVLGRFGWMDRFHFVLTAEDVTHCKPHPEVYLTAAKRFGLSPQRVLVLEDSENGCQAAIAAGTFAVAVPSRHSIEHDFTGASLVAESLADARIYQALGLETPR
jgi:HAD superfamily hydrolase (TIGR01509 family)